MVRFLLLLRRAPRFSRRALLTSVLLFGTGGAIAAYLLRLPTQRAHRFFAAIQQADFDAAEQMLADPTGSYEAEPWREWLPEQRTRASFRLRGNDPYLRWGERLFTIEVPTYGMKMGAEYYFYSKHEGIVYWMRST